MQQTPSNEAITYAEFTRRPKSLRFGQNQRFIKCNKCFLSQKLTKFSDFILESGGCMSLFLYMRLLPAVDVAASDLRCVGVLN